MNRVTLGWAAAAGVLTAICMGAAEQPAPEIGRYQVASGTCETRRQDGTLKAISVVLLVDTVTGQTRALYGPAGENIRWTGVLQADGKQP